MHVQVRKGKQNKTVRFQQVLSVPDFSCDDFLAINPSDAYLNSIDNGQSGHFTLDKYDNNMSCFIDFGSQCNGAVDIELTHLSVEDLDTETCEYDYAKFAYTASDGTQMYTDDFCGCMHDLDVDYSLHYSQYDFSSHPSCDYFVYMDFFFAKSADQLTETLLGTDFKFIFVSDSDTPGGKVSVEWQCASITTTATTTTTTTVPPTATNTVEMADALMTGGFSPNLAIDYGCAGRGAFDAFSQSLGQPVDEIDHAFFAWKKCVQCASDGDKTTIGSYDYDTTGDSCGELLFFYSNI